jgi:hypothetical protein
VRFQRAYEGEPLDDLIVISDLPSGEAKLALQVKRDIAFGEQDATFDKVMRAGWETVGSSDFTPGTDRFGLAIGLYSKSVDEHYQTVLSWARNSVNADDFLSRVSIEKLSSQTQRSFVSLIRNKLDQCAGRSIDDEELWNFLRAMVILYFDFQREGSRDQSHAIEMLRHSMPLAKQGRASTLFQQLAGYAAEASRTAGSHNGGTLTQRLRTGGYLLLPAADCRDDLVRLSEHARFVLNDIKTDINGLELNRVDVLAEAQEEARAATLLELTGPPGAGKSAVLKALVEARKGEGPVMVLAGDRITGTGWDGLAGQLRLERSLKDLLSALGGTASPCLFIDGVDRIDEHGPRMAVNDLIRGLAGAGEDGIRSENWTVVVTVREENLQELHSWLDWRVLDKPKALRVAELSDDDLKVVGDHGSHLRQILAMQHLRPVTRNPFMLNLLEDRRMLLGAETVSQVVTEMEISSVWWERVVNDGGTLGISRRQALLKLGERAARSPGRRLTVEDIPADVLRSLETDRVLLREAGRDVYRFGHDLLEDWVLCRALDPHREDVAEYLLNLDQPFGLFRAVQLLGASLLEQEETAEEWMGLVEQVEQTEGLAPRWRQALLTAPLISTRARDLLDKAEPLLIDGDAGRLADLLVALRTVEVNPDFSYLPVLATLNEEPNDLASILFRFPVPRWRVWSPLMGWLINRAPNLPAAIRPEAARVMEIWQQKAPDGSIYRREVGEITFAWLRETEEEQRYGRA